MKINDIVNDVEVSNKLHDSVGFYNKYNKYICQVFTEIEDKAKSEFNDVICDDGSILINLPESVDSGHVAASYKSYIEQRMCDVRPGYSFDANPVFKVHQVSDNSIIIARKDS